MNRVEHLKRTMLNALQSGTHADVFEMAAHLGPDTPRRAQIAMDILSKSKKKDLSDKVRVERDYMRNGVLCHGVFWVLPNQVKKGDVVTGNSHLLQNGAKAASEAKKPAQKAEPKKSAPSVKHGASLMQKLKAKQAKDLASKTAKPEVEKKQTAETKPAAKKTTPETKQTEKKPAPKPDTKKAEPKTETKPAEKKPVKQKTQPKATKKAKVKKEPPKAKIFSVKIEGAPDDLMKKVYDDAGLDYSNNLSEYNAMSKATTSLNTLAQMDGGSYYKEAATAILTQHAKARFGDVAFRKSEAKYGNCAGGFHNLDLDAVAATALMWNHCPDERPMIAKAAKGDPATNVRILMAQTLVHMIDESPTQKTALYRGAHVPKSVLADMLKTGKTDDLQGIVTTTPDMQKATAHALQTAADEVPVVIEYPESLFQRALEMADNDVLTLNKTGFGVKSITKDAGGVYHVTLQLKGLATKPDASAEIYESVGLTAPDQQKTEDDAEASNTFDGTLTEEQFNKIFADTYGLPSAKHVSTYNVSRDKLCKGVDHVYSHYGYDAAVQYVTMFAQSVWKGDYWANKFGKTKSGYDPTLIAMMRSDWADSQYPKMRDMEKEELNEHSSGADVYYKIGAEVLNTVIETDGVAQPKALYRGLKSWKKGMDKYLKAQEGDKVTLGAMSSFSEKLSIANGFADYDGVVLRVLKSSKTKCTYIEGLSEAEHLVQDAEFEVVKREKKGSRTVLTLKPVE